MYPVIFEEIIDINWRLFASSNVGRIDNYKNLVCSLLPLYLPVVFLEGFNLFRKRALGLHLHRPKAMFTGNSLTGNLIYKLHAAEWQKEGTKLLSGQHGGGYGIDSFNLFEEYETRVSDCFYTWGWRRLDRPVKPLAPPIPHYLRHKTLKIVLICVDYPKTIHRIHYQPMGDQVSLLHDETCEFLLNLSDHKQLLIRRCCKDYGWGVSQKINNAAPEAKCETTRSSSFKLFAKSQLVVHNYLGTSYLETLALNIPTVCFYDIQSYAFRTEAQPLINALEKASIIHRSGKDAAKFVSSISNNPNSWWSKNDVQEARYNFVRQYANFSNNWMKEWEEEFQSQIQQ